LDVTKHSEVLRDQDYEASLPPGSNRDYEYNPNPITHWPPVPHNLMKNWIYCPKDIRGSTVCTERFPKYRSQDVLSKGGGDDIFGWGIELVEGRYWKWLFVPLSLLLFLSTAFGAAWAYYKNDISGGFAVASYMIAAATLLIGTIEVAWDHT
jgi:hypothetical protein